MFDGQGRKVGEKRFNAGADYLESKRQGSYDLVGDRVIKLGGNMYEDRNVCSIIMSVRQVMGLVYYLLSTGTLVRRNP